MRASNETFGYNLKKGPVNGKSPTQQISIVSIQKTEEEEEEYNFWWIIQLTC